jgi:GNAT superfamily N-acetyltransferase
MALSSPAPRVRPIQRTDYAAWRPLWDGYNAFYERSGQTALPEAITAATWSRFFDAYEPVHAFVAADGEKLVGLVHFLYHRSTTLLGPVCYLQDLFALEAARGQGVGRALIAAVYGEAARADCQRVYWHTRATNATAMRLYNQVAEQTIARVYRKDLP